ncbi:MAG: hypothetical protein V7641_2898 [Blastocatellia bacterium]
MEITYYLKFVFKGIDQPIVYEVTKGESDRVVALIPTPPEQRFVRFIEFETVIGRLVNVNPFYILLCQALFDMGVIVPENGDAEDAGIDDERAVFRVDGMEDPLVYEDVDLEEIGLVAQFLQDPEPGQGRFVSFRDEDGETNLLKVDDIILMESGNYNLDEEEDD